MYNQIKEAMSVLKEKSEIIDDRYRLGYHIMAPANWINDPNGCIFYNGKYHVFYQHNPFSEKWGPMYWGHVTSKDLINWKHEIIALAPSKEFDVDGIFSGTATINPENNELVAFYTGHRWINQKDDTFEQIQGYAISNDGINFVKPKNNKIDIEVPKDSNHHIRDPKVWHDGHMWNMILGNSTIDKRGRVLLYKSKDLSKWTYVGVLAESNGELGYMWECPDFIRLEDKDILLFSPQGINEEGEKYKNYNQTGYVVGKFNYDTNKLEHSKFYEIDYGHDFYAIQTLKDNKGRRIAIAWMDMWESIMPTQEDGWCGAMTLPRELVLMKNDRIKMKPIEELKDLREEKILDNDNVFVSDKKNLQLGWENDFMELNLSVEGKSNFSIEFNSDNDEKVELQINLLDRYAKLIRNYETKGIEESYRYTEISDMNNIDIRIFIDSSSIEVFINDGEYVFTSRMYPDKNNRNIVIKTKEKINIRNMRVWNLKNIWQ